MGDQFAAGSVPEDIARCVAVGGIARDGVSGGRFGGCDGGSDGGCDGNRGG